jgi:hypothetical protein
VEINLHKRNGLPIRNTYLSFRDVRKWFSLNEGFLKMTYFWRLFTRDQSYINGRLDTNYFLKKRIPKAQPPGTG